MLAMSDRYQLDKIKELEPAFSNGYGWLSLAELNLIDPYCDRFEVVEEIIFIDGTIYMSVVPKLDGKWQKLKELTR
jgi:hypothetical protein